MTTPTYSGLDPADLFFFSCVASSDSLASAARRLDITPSAVTQRLQQLERRLGMPLLRRQRKSLTLTAEGEILLQRSPAIIRACNDLTEELLSSKAEISGPLFVLAPFGFGRRYIAPLVARFQMRHPQLNIVLHLSDAPLSQQDDHWDVRVHIGALKDSTMVAYPLADNDRLVLAAPAYLAQHGVPLCPDDLASHHCLVLRENLEDVSLWKFRKDGANQGVRVQPLLSSNDGEVVRDWAVAGRGVLIRSEWDVFELIRNGALVRVMADYQLAPSPVVAVLTSTAHKPLRTDAFLAFLKTELGPLPPWRRAARACPAPG